MKKLNRASAAVIAVASTLAFFGPFAVQAMGPASVNLLSAGNFTILSKTGISTTGSTSVVGDIGVSPAAATYITGFSLSLPAAGAFSTSPLVVGKVFAPGYADPTSAILTAAVNDMQTAYTDAAGRTNPTATELGAGNIGGMTLAPGLYKWGTGVTIPSNLTLSGGANDVWIFQIAQNLDVNSGVQVALTGGAQAGNVFWVVAGQTTLGTTASFKGNILDQTAIVLNTGAVLNGRALAQTAVTLDANTVFVSLTAAPAVPVTPVVPLVPVTTPVVTTTSTTVSNGNGNGHEVLCPTGHDFSETTGERCTGHSSTPDVVSCKHGDMYSETTGKSCTSWTSISQSTQVSAPSANLQATLTVREVNEDHMYGSEGASVESIQEFLVKEARGPAAAALEAHGTTMNFGSLTKAALAEWQKSVGITPTSGYFGPKTREYIGSHY